MSTTVLDSDKIKRWSTQDVPPAKRLDYFAAAVSEAVIPMGIDQADPATFFAELSFANLADIGVTKARGESHSSFRGSYEISKSSDRSFNLLMSTQTNWGAEHRGSMSFAPRDILVIDSEFPVRTKVNTPFDAINISVSEEWLRRWVPDPGILAARRIPGDSMWGLTLSSYLCALSPELAAAPPLPLTVMADQVGSLLALTASHVHGTRPSYSKGVISLRDRILECIRQRASEPGLTAGDISSSLQISLRTLHRALASQQETFGGILMDTRVAAAMRMLQSPLFKNVTIEGIAFRAGFMSASHFSLVIKARTGRTPRQFRRSEPQPS